MLCVAICHDAASGAAARSALFQTHAAHNIARMGAFLLTGPIADDDGSTGVGDDPRLTGSLYCLDTESVGDARALMESDPFMNHVWDRIDYYEWRSPSGIWSDERARPKGLSPAYRCYIAASCEEDDVEDALMSGRITHLASTGGPAPALQSIAVLRAETIAAARATIPAAAWVAAMPIAIGRWVGIASPADLPALP
jgi:uncharacterized protein YciI